MGARSEEPQAEPAWSVYVLRCGDRTLYTGVALDVAARLARHRAGLGAKYVRGRGPLELVFERAVGARGEALRAERALKALSRPAKLALVAEPSLYEALVGSRRAPHDPAPPPDGS